MKNPHPSGWKPWKAGASLPDQYSSLRKWDHPQVKAAGLVIEVEHKEAGLVKTVGPLARFNGEIPPPVVASPALGQHNDKILSELGYSPGEANRWRKDRVVG